MVWMLAVMLCFFFSSRRRHTRYIGDWSSDVCSSDLERRFWTDEPVRITGPNRMEVTGQGMDKIGRASCRERGEGWGVGGSLKKKKNERDAAGRGQRNIREYESGGSR